jgi:hypothetical protein
VLKYIRGPSLDSRRIFLPFFRNFDFKGGEGWSRRQFFGQFFSQLRFSRGEKKNSRRRFFRPNIFWLTKNLNFIFGGP